MGRHQLLGQSVMLRSGSAILVSLLVACLLAGCVAAQLHADAAGSPPAPAADQAGNAAQSGQPAAPTLPAPSTLPRQASGYARERFVGGSFSSALPNNLVTRDDNTAVYAPGSSAELADAAFGIYATSIYQPQLIAPEVELSWAAGAAPSAGCWLALANRDTDS